MNRKNAIVAGIFILFIGTCAFLMLSPLQSRPQKRDTEKISNRKAVKVKTGKILVRPLDKKIVRKPITHDFYGLCAIQDYIVIASTIPEIKMADIIRCTFSMDHTSESQKALYIHGVSFKFDSECRYVISIDTNESQIFLEKTEFFEDGMLRNIYSIDWPAIRLLLDDEKENIIHHLSGGKIFDGN